MKDLFGASAYGGPGWSPRTTSLRQEIGGLWAPCGVSSEWSQLKAVLLHQPGPELQESVNPDRWQMLEPLDVVRAQKQHDGLTRAYHSAGVTVHNVEPSGTPTPNLMFVADLMFMTPEGAILGRPASSVRAGEERVIARKLASLGVPILRSVRGRGTFEGADAAWIDPDTVVLATGPRTNTAGADQVAATLAEMGASTLRVDLPHGAMHLMGLLRLVDRDLAIAWPGRVPHAVVEALHSRGFTVHFLHDEGEAKRRMALNFVTLAPRHILMPAGSPVSQAFYESAGIHCEAVEVDELAKAAGAIGCLTGVLERLEGDPYRHQSGVGEPGEANGG